MEKVLDNAAEIVNFIKDPFIQECLKKQTKQN